MKILFEDPEFNIFEELEDCTIEELVKNEYSLLMVARAIMLDLLGPGYNLEEDTVIRHDYEETLWDLGVIFEVMPSTVACNDVIQRVYSEYLNSFQILLKIYKDSTIEPVCVRVNNEIKGRILGAFEVSFQNSRKLKRIYNTIFELPEEEREYSHITALYHKDREKVSLYCDMKMKNKSYSNKIDFLVPYIHMTEEQFLEHAKEKGYPVSSKSLRNYRNNSHQCIFPMPFICKEPVTGIVKKYYDKTWIKYLKRIKELKDILKKDEKLYFNYNIKKLRDMDRELGGNSFKNILFKETK